LFWPELAQEHARASLRKAIHHLRRVLGDDAIVGRGDDELALGDVVQCDAAEFERLIDAGDAEAALELYRGPLLTGFFVGDAPEFERWLDRERARLRDRAFRGAWHVAESQERAGDGVSAAVWGRRAVALVPEDEGALRQLLQLLDRLGDRAGAVAAYEEFARRLREDFDVEPAAETQELVRLVRARAKAPADDARVAPAATGEQTPSVAVLATAQPTTAEQPDALPEPTLRSASAERPRSRMPGRPMWSRRAMLGMLTAAVVVVIAWRVGLGRTRTALAPSASSVAVLPFVYHGSAEYAYLAEGMASLLGTSLDGIGGMHTVDAGTIAASVPPNDRRVVDVESAAKLAAKFGAARYVIGEITEAGGRLRATATLYDVRGDASRLISRAVADDSAPQLFALVDRLAGELVAEQGTRAKSADRLTRVAAMTTSSLPALKAYLEGERQFRVGHYKEAVDAFQRAVGQDTAFALAYYRLALAYSWSSDTMSRPMARRAIQFSDRLSRPDRLLVEAFLPFITGNADEAERRYRAILSTRPYEGEAWYPLGEVLFHFNPVRGRPIAEAKPMFERALSLGPTDAPLTHLLEIEAIERNYAAFDSLLNGIAPGAHFDLVGRSVRAFTVGTELDRAKILSEIRRTPDPELSNTARHLMFLLEDKTSAERVVRLLLDAERPREAHALGWILLAHLEVSAGRWRAADSALRMAEPLDYGRALENRALFEASPFLAVPDSEIRRTRDALVAWNPSSAGTSGLVFPGDERMHPFFRLYLIGLLDARLGDVAAGVQAATELERAASSNSHAFGLALAHAVRAHVAAHRGLWDEASRELSQVQVDRTAADLLGVVPFFDLLPERFLQGETLRALGQETEALEWYGAFGEHSGYTRSFLAPAYRRRGELLEKAGRNTDAARSFTRFVDLWKDADPELRPAVNDARARVERLRSAVRDSS
jgi:serine/threonine-protein kinase